MEYLLPKEISDRLHISLKTVYNHLTKCGDSIEREKRGWKTFVNFVSFERSLQNQLQNNKNEQYGVDVNSSSELQPNNFVSLQSDLQNLQSDYEQVEAKKNELQKYNMNLQEQVTKYALMLSEEKNEKKEFFKRNIELQDQYTKKIEEFWVERVKYAQKIFVLLGLLISSVLTIVLLLILYRFYI